MLRRFFALLALAALSFAFQDSLATLKLTREKFDSNISYYATQEFTRLQPGIALPTIGSTARPIFLAMSDAGRASVVKELGLAAKSFLMSPAFETAYNASLKSQHNAVDHGLKVTDTSAELEASAKSGNAQGLEAKAQAMMREQYRKVALDQVKQASSLDASMLQMMASSMKDIMESIPPANAAEKTQHAQARTLLAEAVKLAPSNIAAAREKYKAGSLLAVYLDGNNGGGAQVDQAKKEQQLNYNKRAFRPNLKLKLLAFAVEAKTVDFKAATHARGSNTIFANPAYEKKSPLWKLLYRLGPTGTSSAIGIAQSWAAEL